MARIPRRAALALLGAAALAGASPGARATYRMHGTVHLAGALDRDVELHADAVVEPGDGPGEVVLLLAAMGYRCRLVARRDDAGTLAFPPGQICELDVRSPEVRGRVEVRLASGRGQLGEERLSLSLRSELSGALSVGSGRPVVILGRPVPGTGSTRIPIHGTARATAEGRRDHSRAVEPEPR